LLSVPDLPPRLPVPVGYPTEAQQRAGFSGGAIGIHGPPRGFETAMRLLALVETEWTAGCIAVATDDEIERIVAWIHQRRVKGVRLVR
jgi:L,D-transpeptidase catalytic domain